MKYAQSTRVSSNETRAEIEKILRRYGATHYGIIVEPGKASVQFVACDRMVRFELVLPDRKGYERTEHRRQLRSAEATSEAWEQACRQRWRALALSIKAKLEAVESKISTFEAEFLANIILADGQSIGQFMIPQIQESYKNKGIPRMLPGIGGTGN